MTFTINSRFFAVLFLQASILAFCLDGHQAELA